MGDTHLLILDGLQGSSALSKDEKILASCANAGDLYGPRDNFHPEHSHVVPALIRKVVEAKDAGKKRITV
jgi:GDP-L-fucose synthase